MMKYRTAQTIINNVAVEVGLSAVTDPYASSDNSFVQLRSLLNSSGDELLSILTWQQFIKTHTITVTNPGDDGNYVLPDDFGFFIDQTGWDYSNDDPLAGPLTDAQWNGLLANDVSSNDRIYFRLAGDNIQLFPQPPADGTIIKFEYSSRAWVDVEGVGTTFTDECIQASDIPLFDGILIQKLLKLKWLQAKGFDTTAAVTEFNIQFDMWSSRQQPVQIANLARNTNYPLLSGYSVGDSNFG